MTFYFTIGLVYLIGFLIPFFTFKNKIKTVCCIGWGVVIVFSVIFLLLGPKTAVKPIRFDSENTIERLNEIVVYLLIIEAFVAQLGVFFICNSGKVTSSKGMPIVAGIILAVAIIALGIGWGIYTVSSIT